jgi:hypothetical protein
VLGLLLLRGSTGGGGGEAGVLTQQGSVMLSQVYGAISVISDSHFSVQLNRFIPGFLSYSVPVSKVTIGYYPR